MQCQIQPRQNPVLSKQWYMREVVSELGFSPGQDKISAIHNMPTLSCKQDLKRLLGMINYLTKYDTVLTKLKSVLSTAPIL